LRERFALDAELKTALEQGPLTILALGPLTNLAAVLREHPQLRKNVARLVAVMGRRPGHIFHPAEGAGRGMLFGHGPVFRDFNFALDPDAAARVLAMRLPISLVPYDAARGIELTAEDLGRLENSLPWIVERSRGWLDYWRTAIGRSGFYPFDLIAAAYVVEPSWLRCTPVRAWVGEDDTLFLPWAPRALLVEPDADGAVLYCGLARGKVKQRVMAFFT
jgi:purine nucleosidase